MKIIVTGGAGYIGSHTVRMLAEESGRKVVVLDNLKEGVIKPLDQSSQPLIAWRLRDVGRHDTRLLLISYAHRHLLSHASELERQREDLAVMLNELAGAERKCRTALDVLTKPADERREK